MRHKISYGVAGNWTQVSGLSGPVCLNTTPARLSVILVIIILITTLWSQPSTNIITCFSSCLLPMGFIKDILSYIVHLLFQEFSNSEEYTDVVFLKVDVDENSVIIVLYSNNLTESCSVFFLFRSFIISIWLINKTHRI